MIVGDLDLVWAPILAVALTTLKTWIGKHTKGTGAIGA